MRTLEDTPSDSPEPSPAPTPAIRRITVYADRELVRELDRRAEIAGMTRSAYVRWGVLAAPAPPQRAAPPPAVEVPLEGRKRGRPVATPEQRELSWARAESKKAERRLWVMEERFKKDGAGAELVAGLRDDVTRWRLRIAEIESRADARTIRDSWDENPHT